MSTMRDVTNTPLRDAYGPHFSLVETESGTNILYAGQRLIRVKLDKRLPKGFHDRLVQHLFDMLTGKKTALWDEQRVFGERAYDAAHGRYNAARRAEVEAAQREGRPPDLASIPQP
jgi:hypothetical protein